MTWPAIVSAVLAVLGGGGGVFSLLTISAVKRRMMVEADSSVVAAAMRITGVADSMMDALQKRIHQLESEVDDLRGKVRAMMEQAWSAAERIHELEMQLERTQQEM